MVLAGLTLLAVLSSAWRILAAAEHAVTPVRVFGGGGTAGTAAVRKSLAEGGAAPGASTPSTAPTRAAPGRQDSGDVNLHSGEPGHPSRAPGAHLSCSVVPVPLVQGGHGPGGGQRPGDGDSKSRDAADPIPQVAGGVQHHVWLGLRSSRSSALPLVMLRLQSRVLDVTAAAVSC